MNHRNESGDVLIFHVKDNGMREVGIDDGDGDRERAILKAGRRNGVSYDQAAVEMECILA